MRKIKIKRIPNKRYPERNLGFAIMGLSTLCKSASVERNKYLISLFNSKSPSLEEYEKCYVMNYILTGRVDNVNNMGYKLYKTENGDEIILSDEEVKSGKYEVELEIGDDVDFDYLIEYQNYLDIMAGKKPKKDLAKISDLISELTEEGFDILCKDDEFLAFNKDRNIVFYSNSLEKITKYYGTKMLSFFQQPFIAHDKTTHVGFMGDSLSRCYKEKVDFPKFGYYDYLWLYNANKDGDEPFVGSMKKIAQYKELYDAVGPENQILIDEIVATHTDEPDAPSM